MPTARMRAVGFGAYGGPEVLDVLDLPVPDPAVGQVRVKVWASTVNPADVQFCRGDHAAFVSEAEPPFCGGLEFVGTVDAVPGQDAAEGRLAVGCPVAGSCHFIPTGRGAHAEYVVVDERSITPVPRGLDPVLLTTVPMNGLTAQVVVDSLGAEPGGVVAITGAAGVVGAFVTELAVQAGRRVVAIASPGDEEFLMTLGAEAFVARGHDVVERVRRLHPGGVAALVDAAMVESAAMPLVADGGRFLGLRPGHLPAPARGIEPRLVSFRRYQERTDVLEALVAKVSRGDLRPRVNEVFGLDRAREAFEKAAEPGHRGRMVLQIGQGPLPQEQPA